MAQKDRRPVSPCLQPAPAKEYYRLSWDSTLPSLLPHCCSALGRLTFQLLRRHQHLRRHSRHVRALGIVETHFQHDRLDGALAPAHIALRREISLDAFEEDFAGAARPAWQSHAKRVSIADMVGIRFRDR